MKGELNFTNGRGKKVTREINYTLDTRSHAGEPGWAWLAIAANPHLSIADLVRLLELEGIERSRSWIQRRRWLFQDSDKINSRGYPNADGKDDSAIAIIRANPRMSARQLVRLLGESHISRSHDWVWRHRCD
jgi:hypothetical protein